MSEFVATLHWHFSVFPLLVGLNYHTFLFLFLAFCTNQFQIAPDAQLGHCPFSICNPEQLRSEQLKSTRAAPVLTRSQRNLIALFCYPST